jgi:hypothetical protein
VRDAAIILSVPLVFIAILTLVYAWDFWHPTWKQRGERRAEERASRLPVLTDPCAFTKDGAHKWDQWEQPPNGYEDRQRRVCMTCNAIMHRRIS